MSPTIHPHPNLLDRDPNLTFDLSKNLKFAPDVNQHGNPARTTLEDTHFEKPALKELCSGYTMNRQHWDGSGWGTERNQHTDQIRTTYRLGYNQAKPFHKTELRNNNGRFNHKQIVFDTKDKYTNKAMLDKFGMTH